MNEKELNSVETEKADTIENKDNGKNKKDKKDKPYKRRRIKGDRTDGRKVKTSSPMLKAMPYIMSKRSDAQNTYADSFDITEVDKFCRKMHIN